MAAADEGRMLLTLDRGIGNLRRCQPGSHAGIVALRPVAGASLALQTAAAYPPAITSPAWTPALLGAAAIVTEVGGMLSHAAIVARVRHPAVVAVPNAMTRLPDGSTVRVDGTSGVITALESARDAE